MALYILYFIVKEQAIFYWGRVISHEISSQLSSYKREFFFYMSSYLVFAIALSCRFPQLSLSKNVNCEFHPVTFWYKVLWKHKASHYFYEVFNDFLSIFKVLLLGEDAPRISEQATSFLDKKGTIEHLDNYTVIIIFGSTEQPALLPCHIMDIMFLVEVARQYNYWFHLFQRKKKKQFIPLPWKIGEFVLKNINKIYDFPTHFSIYNLRYDEYIRGFDPYDTFRQHLQTLGLDDCFVNKHLPKTKDSGDNGPASDVGDVETVQSCTKLYTQ
jgi:hypothetical protein